MKTFVERALRGQTPSSLLALSYEVDKQANLLFLKAHFSDCPTEEDCENIMDVEGEVIAAFSGNYKVDTELEVLSPTGIAHPLSQGFCYHKDA